MIRSRYGKWSSEVMVQGATITLGTFEYRSEAIKAEAIAGKIREGLAKHQKAVDRTKLIEKFRFKEVMSAIKDSGVVR